MYCVGDMDGCMKVIIFFFIIKSFLRYITVQRKCLVTLKEERNAEETFARRQIREI